MYGGILAKSAAVRQVLSGVVCSASVATVLTNPADGTSWRYKPGSEQLCNAVCVTVKDLGQMANWHL